MCMDNFIMASVLPESRIPELKQSPDRVATSKLPPSNQPVVRRLHSTIAPVFSHQKMPSSQHESFSSKVMDEQDQYLPAANRSTVHHSTTKKQQRYFSDFESTPPRDQSLR